MTAEATGPASPIIAHSLASLLILATDGARLVVARYKIIVATGFGVRLCFRVIKEAAHVALIQIALDTPLNRVH